MVFSSLIFVFLFLPILLIAYTLSQLLNNIKISNIVLLTFSLIFIYWGSGSDILILIAMVLVNYFAGYLLDYFKDDFKRKIVLSIAITVSLGLLFWFKYSLFFLQKSRTVLGFLNLSYSIPDYFTNIVLPLGISFYTFQALSYTIDVYRKKCYTTKNFFDFLLYVSLFPQLIAGPIVRYSDINNQIQSRSFTIDRIYSGTIRFLMGLCKKIILANTVAVAADRIFSLEISHIDMTLSWIGIVAYSLQIYLDFSAYSDMAIGLGRIFGFDFKENFNFPYIATTVQDFWRRWHISLSSWLKDYLYIPLGGNRKGKTRTYINLIIVFFLCGLWHGANMTFVVWGLWHGVFLIIERTKLGAFIRKLPNFIRRIYVLLQAAIGWVIFRSVNLEYAFGYLKKMFIFKPSTVEMTKLSLEILQNDFILAVVFGISSSIGLFVIIKNKVNNSCLFYKLAFHLVLICLFLISIAMLYSGGYNPFIYFRF